MTKRNPETFKALLGFAHRLADLSGPVVMRHFRKKIAVENKLAGSGFDPVTAADKGAERAIAKALKAAYPSHGLIGEEHGNHQQSARYRWVVDPIDGTRSFIIGSPMWGTLIGLLDGEAPVLGMMDQPYTGERFWAGERASFCRDAKGKVTRLKTRRCPSIGDAIAATTHPDLFATPGELRTFMRLKAQTRMTRYGGDCYSYALLAAGFIDIVIESGLKPFDIVALIPIVERAGGRVTTWDGKPASSGGRILATGDPELHEKVVAMLRG